MIIAELYGLERSLFYMHKGYKKLITVALGSVFALGAFSFTGCATKVELDGDYAYGSVSSNGGFVVEKGNYIYFINGQESNTADNSGSAVKGALMRISVSDFKKGNYGETQIVVPSLMVTANYDAGIYIYGDRVYYATPTTAKDLDGQVRNGYLDFKSTRLDGKDTIANYYFRSSDNSAAYRYTEIDGVVYCLHVDGSSVYSYNTATGEDTLLVKDASSILFDQTDATGGRIYYTMDVTVDIDTENAYKESYNQIYTATADMTIDSLDAKTASYTVRGKTYSFDKQYLEEEKEDFDAKDVSTYPYVNLGQLVLDGKGSTNVDTMFNEEGTPFTPGGYKYTLSRSANGGLYYTRDYVDTTSSSGDGGWLLYLSEENFKGSWNALSGNFGASAAEKNEVIAYNTDLASSSAIFMRENGKNSYLYVDGSAIYRMDVSFENGMLTEESCRIVNSASGATLLYTDKAGDYGYVYYSTAGTNGKALNRAVYSGTADDYNAIAADKNYQPVRILEIEYTSDWYLPEIIENKIVYTNAEAIGSNAYNYVSVVDLSTANGMKTNAEVAAFNDLYADRMKAISDLRGKHNALGNLEYYYYYTNAFSYPKADTDVFEYYGDTKDFYHSILAEAADRGYSSTYLYSDLYQSEMDKILAREKGELGDYTYLDENGNYYGLRSYFYNDMGKLTEEDAAAIADVWRTGNVLTLPEEEEGLETWQWVLIGVGIGVGVLAIAAGVTIPLIVMSKKKKARLAALEEAKPGLHHVEVDTTDDKEIDVYDEESAQKLDPQLELTEDAEPAPEEEQEKQD